ncbi:MAG: hypothetical protein K8T25_09440, partial [Planctomycetia bacterium]|nr:hypothetical protein [Planctomycetia bacterium]
GRPILYGTSRKFLQVFGLRHLDDLPRAAVLRRQVDESVISSVTPTSLVTADVNQKEPDAMSASIAAATGTELEEDEKRLGTTAANPLFAPRAEEDDDLDDDEDEDDDEDDDDDDAEDAEEEWEEVEDDEEELDEDEDEDEDDEDEDWDDDDDEDWEDEEEEDEDDDEDDSWDDEEEEEEADEEE